MIFNVFAFVISVNLRDLSASVVVLPERNGAHREAGTQ